MLGREGGHGRRSTRACLRLVAAPTRSSCPRPLQHAQDGSVHFQARLHVVAQGGGGVDHRIQRLLGEGQGRG